MMGNHIEIALSNSGNGCFSITTTTVRKGNFDVVSHHGNSLFYMVLSPGLRSRSRSPQSGVGVGVGMSLG